MQWLDYLDWRGEFAAVMDPRLYTIEYLDRLIAERAGRLWTSDAAAIVAEIKTFPTGAKAVHGLIAAGDLDQIVNTLIPQAEQWGREQGCILALIDSREGWGRVMKQHGYEPFQTAIAKEL